MPLTFPPSYIENAVQGAVTRYTTRVDILEADATTLFVGDVPFTAGTVTIDMAADARRTAGLTLFNEAGRIDIDRDNGFWYDKVIRLTMGVNTASGNWERTIGHFLGSRIGSKNYDSTINLTLRDFSKKLQYDIPYSVAWPTATPIENIISDLATGGGIPPSGINLPLTGISTDDERSFAAGAKRWKSIVDVASAYNYDVYFDEDGILTMRAFTDPFLSAPEYAFQVGANSNIASIDREISDELIRNHIVVTGEEDDGTPVWAEATNTNATSPTRIAKLGYRTKRIESSWVRSTAQAQSMADRVLQYEGLEKFEARLGTILVPWLDVNETVEFDDPLGAVGDPTKWLLRKVVLPMNLGVAEAQLARVTDVS